MNSRNVQAVLTALRPRRLVELLAEAVDAYSPTYAEAPATEVFERALLRGGLTVVRQPVANPSGNGARHNLLIRLGPEPLALLFVGHVDTIPAGSGAMRFAPARIDDDRLIGLGAADMKSGCAAMVEAVLAVAESGLALRHGVGLALVVGEEEYGDGSAALPDAFCAPLTVVGEPTNLSPCIEHYGYLECQLLSRGIRSHAALAGQGGGAIHALLTWLLGILDGAEPTRAGIAINPRLVQGGGELFVVADRCEATLDVHWRPGVEVDEVVAAIERGRGEAQRSHTTCQLEYRELFRAQGYSNRPSEPRLQPLAHAFDVAELPWSPGVFRSHSDADLFQQRGSVAVVCGPGALEVAHAPGEFVSLAETERAARLYACLATLLCTGA